jgi:hypothetical protein
VRALSSCPPIPSNKYIHLLPDIHRERGRIEVVDHLQDARIDSLGVVSRQRLLGKDERFDPGELERDRLRGAFQ